MDTAVYEIQSYIRNISRIDGDIPSLVPDGIYGEETTRSVTAFQRKHFLPQTGKVDLDTWNKLSEESDKAVYIFSEPVETAPARKGDFPLKKGKDSHLNGNVNLMLVRLSDFYRNFDGAALSLDYTEETERLIGIFQSLTGNTVTGETDKSTWNMLSYLYLLLTEDERV
ncbi:MAG: peptidoglycan-binding protein [Clostridia bacterium]|nr:peptidoglycan-binding protein [Clostridia bacterium]